MHSGYQFQNITIKLHSIIEELQKWGDEGWEITKIEPDEEKGENRGPEREVILRRPVGSSPEPNSWEYHKFVAADEMPHPDWENHLSNCSWTIIAKLSWYAERPFYLAKRPERYKRTDDGDIMAHLNKLESDHLVHIDSWKLRERVREILEIKKQKQLEKGHNIDVSDAVKFWLAYKYIPELLEKNDVSVTDRSPETLLEELCSLHVAIRSTSLNYTVEYWCRNLR